MADLALGDEVAGYRIDARLARGGMGVVYRATHLGLDRPVALKVIARELAGDASFRERFQRESRLAARLDHPAVVPVFDSREVDGELIVAMRLVEGGDLRGLIDREGPLAPERATALLGQVAEALDAAHAAGIVHRDVKPHNVLVEGDRAYLSDFGLAKAIGEGSEGSAASVVGTVAYMAPEQWRGEATGPPADIYALGCVLFEAVTGIVPYARADADPEATPQMPAGLERAIERATAPRPADRFATASELIEAARAGAGSATRPTRVLMDRSQASPKSRRPLLAGGALVLLAVIVVAALLLTGGSSSPTVAAPVPIGQPPLRIAAGSEKIWVLSEPEGTLTRIDAESDEVTGAPIDLGKGVAAVAVGGGAVWVTDAHAGTIRRIDLGSFALGRPIPAGRRPAGITVADGLVWVADARSDTVTRVDPAIQAVSGAPIEVGEHPGGIDAGTSAVWVTTAGADAVRRLELPSGEPDGGPIAVGPEPGAVAVGLSAVWVVNDGDGSVTRIEP